MALLAGTAVTPNSMAKALYDATNAEFGVAVGDLDTDRRRMCEVFASAIVAHIKTHGDVIVTASDSGLQRDNTAGTPDTLAPSAPVTLSGAID